jgi:hypothetical protein
VNRLNRIIFDGLGFSYRNRRHGKVARQLSGLRPNLLPTVETSSSSTSTLGYLSEKVDHDYALLHLMKVTHGKTEYYPDES